MKRFFACVFAFAIALSIKSFALTRINGVVKLYVATV